MRKIIININNTDILFSYKTNQSSINDNLVNTNIISNNELIFSDEYIRDNYRILSSFIKELAIQYNINRVIFTKVDLAEFIIPVLDRAITIKDLVIKENEALTYMICENLIKIKHPSLTLFNFFINFY